MILSLLRRMGRGQSIAVERHRSGTITPKDATGGVIGAGVVAETGAMTGHQGGETIIPSIDQGMIGMIDMTAEGERITAQHVTSTDIRKAIEESVASFVAPRDLSEEGGRRKLTGLGQGMDDYDEVEAPSVTGEGLQMTVVDLLGLLIIWFGPSKTIRSLGNAVQRELGREQAYRQI